MRVRVSIVSVTRLVKVGGPALGVGGGELLVPDLRVLRLQLLLHRRERRLRDNGKQCVVGWLIRVLSVCWVCVLTVLVDCVCVG